MSYSPQNVVYGGDELTPALDDAVRKLTFDLESREMPGVSEWGWTDSPEYVIALDEEGYYTGLTDKDIVGCVKAEPVKSEELELEEVSDGLENMVDEEKNWQYEIAALELDINRRRFDDLSDLVRKAGNIMESRSEDKLATGASKLYSNEEIGL